MNNFRTIDARDSNDDTDSFMTETATTRYDAQLGDTAVIGPSESALAEATFESGREVLDP